MPMSPEVEQARTSGLAGWSGKTCPEPSQATEGKTSPPSSKKRSKSSARKCPLFLCLTMGGGDGPQVDASRMWEDNGALRGEYSMHSFGVRPSAVVVSRLSQILVASPPPKYCLSARACLGILTRAKRRGRPLPVPLERALQRQALGLTPPPTLSVCGQDETGGGQGSPSTGGAVRDPGV